MVSLRNLLSSGLVTNTEVRHARSASFLALALALWIALAAPASPAHAQGIEVKRATVTFLDEAFVLEAEFDIALTHTLEDEGIFPHLRRSDPALVPVLDRLVEEHHVIHEVLEGVDRALVALVASPGEHAALRGAVDLMTDTLLSHFAYEEQELLGPLARHGMYPGQL